MSTRRRIGVSSATTEAARRQLMQPVQCWEKAWTTPDNTSNVKAYKWTKTDKTQTFSDDEGEVDQPLAPLPDEPEVIEDGDADEDIDADEPLPSVGPTSRADSEVVRLPNEDSKPPSPRPPHPLSMSFSATELQDESDILDIALKPLEVDMALSEALPDDLSALPLSLPVDEDVVGNIDLSQLGPDGTVFEAENDLSQLEPTDQLLGGPTTEDTADPFRETAP